MVRLNAVVGLLVFLLGAGSVMAEESAADAKLLQELTALEKQSWEATLTDDKDFFRDFLAPEAKGMLADGSIIDRDGIIKNLDDLHVKKYTMGKGSLLRVSQDAVMLLYPASYEAVHKGVEEKFSAVNSSALYVQRGGKWKQLFYQETPTGAQPDAAKR